MKYRLAISEQALWCRVLIAFEEQTERIEHFNEFRRALDVFRSDRALPNGFPQQSRPSQGLIDRQAGRHFGILRGLQPHRDELGQIH